MRNKIVWSIVSLLMVAALLLVSCGQRAAPTPAPTTTPAPTPGVPTPAPVTPAPGTPIQTPPPASTEKPKYGGTLSIIRLIDLQVFDPGVMVRAGNIGQFVYEEFMYQNWARGLAGTSEVDWGTSVYSLEDYNGQLAESFEIPSIDTIVFKIRRGVHFAINPASEASRLVNGREYTADDAVWIMNRVTKFPTSWTRVNQPTMTKAATVEKTGPWEVTLRYPVDPLTGIFWLGWATGGAHFPREVVEKYGNIQDWRNAVGTGPFMLIDLVPGSVATFTRNPNYWGKDPVGPGKGNQLPYVDMVKLLIVPDLSTRLAVLRTGRVDWLDTVAGEDGRGLIKTNPNLKYYKFLPTGPTVIGMRTDKEELPFKDIKVRQALMLATDFASLTNDLYGGEAEMLVWPIVPTFKQVYIPMERLPQSVQSLYKYNPEKAKLLLAEAGYPKGFKTKMVVLNASETMDPAAAFKAMWAKVGIDVELQPKERAVFESINAARAHEELVLRTTSGTSFPQYLTLSSQRGPSWNNVSYMDDPPGKDPRIEGTFQEIQKHVIINLPQANELYQGLIPYLLEGAWVVPQPTPYSYRFWQPWVKNYHGEAGDSVFPKYIWIDQDLKEKMTGRR